jgi:hypothetical protein
MSRNKGLNGSKASVAVIVLVGVVLFPVGYSAFTAIFARESPNEVPFIQVPDSQDKQCVRETSYMRYHHWELLRQIREQVVRDGIRGEIGLNSCRECHPNRAQFCNQCHNAVSLHPDCFGCHYYPEMPDEVEDAVQMREAGLLRNQATVIAGDPAEE